MTNTPIEIRPETDADISAIHSVNELTFGRPAEAGLIDALRSNGAATVSLVALIGGQVAGHILFSPVRLEPPPGVGTQRALSMLSLSTLAVLPGYQKQGIGSRLNEAGIAECRNRGFDAIIVIGHAEYYPRFGFKKASGFGLKCTFPAPDEVFMALELRPGALEGVSGTVYYREEFNVFA